MSHPVHLACHPVAAGRPAVTDERRGAATPAIGRALDALRTGCPVVLIDTVRPPGAGYILAAASAITADVMVSIVRDAPGRPWLALPDEQCRALGLREHPSNNPAMEGCMGSIEAREGVTTGISAHDRARTMRVGADPRSGPHDVVTPGHVVVVRTRTDVLAGGFAAADASSELTRLAGVGGAAAVCEMLEADGTVASATAANCWASERGLPAVNVLDVLDAELAARRLVRYAGERAIVTAAGPLRAFTFADAHAGVSHYVILRRDHPAEDPVHLRVVRQEPLTDALAGDRGALGGALAEVGADRSTALVYVSPVSTWGDSKAGGPNAEARRTLIAARREGHLIDQMLALVGLAPADRAPALHAAVSSG